MTQQDHTRKIIGHYERRLQKLKERKAQLGLGTPPEILVEIEDTEAEIRKIKAGWVDVLSTQIEKLATELEKSKSRAATVLLENQSLKDYIAKLEKENQVLKNHVAELEAAPIPNANRKILPASYLDSRPDHAIC